MILTTFKKIFKDNKGSVEFVESALIIPIILSFISILLILSLSTIYKAIIFEQTYYKSRIMLQNTSDNNILINEIDPETYSKENEKLKHIYKNYGKNNYHLVKKENLFFNEIYSYDDNLMYKVKKIYYIENIRKIDFIYNNFLKDLLNKIKIEEIIPKYENLSKSFLENIKWKKTFRVLFLFF